MHDARDRQTDRPGGLPHCFPFFNNDLNHCLHETRRFTVNDAPHGKIHDMHLYTPIHEHRSPTRSAISTMELSVERGPRTSAVRGPPGHQAEASRERARKAGARSECNTSIYMWARASSVPSIISRRSTRGVFRSCFVDHPPPPCLLFIRASVGRCRAPAPAAAPASAAAGARRVNFGCGRL